LEVQKIKKIEDKYEVGDVLGSGGFGVVHKATRKENN